MSTILLSVVSPWLVSVLLLILILITLFKVPKLLKLFFGFSWQIQVLLVLCVVIGGSLRFFLTPNIQRIYFDEDRYLSYSVTFARHNKALSIELATPQKLLSGKPDLVARVTVPVINGWVLKLSHYSKTALFLTAKAMSTIQILLIFIAVYLLFKQVSIALTATGLYALLPVPVYWAPSTALDSYFVFFSLLAFIGTCWYAESPGFKSALFFTASTVALLYVRFESFLFLIVLLSLLYIIRVKAKRPIFIKKDALLLILGLPLVGIRALVSLSVLGTTWCCGESTPLEAFSTGYFIRNTLPNLFSLVMRPEFPAIITLFAVVALFGKKNARIIPFALWGLLYFFLYSFYFAGVFYTYEFSGSYGRYFLMLAPPLVVLASISLVDLINYMKGVGGRKKIFLSLLCFIGLLTLVPTVRDYKKLVYVSPYDALVDQKPRQIQEFLEDTVLPQIPPNSIVIHPLSDLVVLHGQTGVYLSSFLDKEDVTKYVVGEMKKGKKAYMMQTYTCDVTDKCEKILRYVTIKPLKLKKKNTKQKNTMEFLELELKK